MENLLPIFASAKFRIYPVDLGDTAYSFNNKENGIYVFWDGDVKAGDAIRKQASDTSGASSQEEAGKIFASSFSAGQFALGGAAGLVIGICGMAIVMADKKKKEENTSA